MLAPIAIDQKQWSLQGLNSTLANSKSCSAAASVLVVEKKSDFFFSAAHFMPRLEVHWVTGDNKSN